MHTHAHMPTPTNAHDPLLSPITYIHIPPIIIIVTYTRMPPPSPATAGSSGSGRHRPRSARRRGRDLADDHLGRARRADLLDPRGEVALHLLVVVEEAWRRGHGVSPHIHRVESPNPAATTKFSQARTCPFAKRYSSTPESRCVVCVVLASCLCVYMRSVKHEIALLHYHRPSSEQENVPRSNTRSSRAWWSGRRRWGSARWSWPRRGKSPCGSCSRIRPPGGRPAAVVSLLLSFLCTFS